MRVSDAGLARIIEVLVRPRTLETVVTSVGLVTVVVTACLLIGIPTAWLLARTNLPLRGMWLVLVSLPLAIPSYVAAYAWLSQFPAMNGFWAAALILTLVSSPYVVLPVTASFRASDPALEEVARSLGRGPFRAFATTTLLRTDDINGADARAVLDEAGIDAMVVIAFGQKIGPVVLDGRFAVNLHASVLPRWQSSEP